MAIIFISKKEAEDAMDSICASQKILKSYEEQRLRSDFFIPISDLISTLECNSRLIKRVEKAFNLGGIKNVGDLMSHTKSDMCKFRNIGSKSLDVIFTLMDDITNGKFLKP